MSRRRIVYARAYKYFFFFSKLDIDSNNVPPNTFIAFDKF